MQDGISVLTPDLKIVHTNKAMVEWYAEHLPLQGKTCFQIYRGLKQPCENCPAVRAIANQGLEMQTLPLLQEGRQTGDLEVYAFPMFDDEGNVTGVVEYIRDVTKRKIAERALADSERRLADIIEFLPDPTWVIETNGRVIAWNLAMERVSDIEKKNMIGKDDYAYAAPFYGQPRPMLIDLVLKRDKKWESMFLTLKDHNGVVTESESYHPLIMNIEIKTECTDIDWDKVSDFLNKDAMAKRGVTE
ncbi:PAS domain-containing protein [Desulfosarcina ovata]|uniref:PAS domain-containing protein n=1 Tax=Desulfosarcina ovata TaxID=83564 RepID=UPI0022B0F586|nr:PAS domain-containing protein [Desulfosarcina ovata]